LKALKITPIKMKLFIFVCLLVVHTIAFRVPLPYGTGIQSSGDQGIGIGTHQGIFHQILSWFQTADNSLKISNSMK